MSVYKRMQQLDESSNCFLVVLEKNKLKVTYNPCKFEIYKWNTFFQEGVLWTQIKLTHISS